MLTTETNKDSGMLDDVESSILVNIVNKWSQFLTDSSVTSRQKKLAWDNIAVTFNKATYDEKKPRRSVEFLLKNYERLQSQNPEEDNKQNEQNEKFHKSNFKKGPSKRPKSKKRERKVNAINNEPKEDNPSRKAPLLSHEEFREQVLFSSRNAERLHKKEIKLRMEQSRETHAKVLELMELKKKTMLVELHRAKAAAHNEERKRMATDEPTEAKSYDRDGRETSKFSAQEGSKAVEQIVNGSSKEGSTGFRRWWKCLIRRIAAAMSRTRTVINTQQTEHSQERTNDRDSDGELQTTIKMSKRTLCNEGKKFKDELVSEWLIGEIKPEISHNNSVFGFQEGGDLSTSGSTSNSSNHASSKKRLIEEISSESTLRTKDDI